MLTLFILIELSRSLVEYFHTHQFRLTLIIDAAFVFVLRETMIKLFKNEASPEELYALDVLLLVLGGVRIGLSVVTQRAEPVIKKALGQ